MTDWPKLAVLIGVLAFSLTCWTVAIYLIAEAT
jgi:hypothetical protein